MRLAIAIMVSASVGCFSSAEKPITAFEVRTGVAGQTWASMSNKDRKLVRRGKVRAGMPEVAAYVAMGSPVFHWDTEVSGRACKVLLFNTKRKDRHVNRAVYTCGGVIAHQAKVSPNLPCWRVSQVAPRIIKKYDYFRKQKLGKQWELLAGILKRGHTNRDVWIAFGKPYNSGFEEREDGTRASNQVFLDHGRESYGLYITLINRKVAGWKVPADRRLTPEAQKKRMEAMEKRLTDKLKEMDERAERRHAETVEYFNDVLANQEEMKDTLVRIDSKVDNVLDNQDVMIANQGQMMSNQGQMMDNQGRMLDNQADLKRGQRNNAARRERTRARAGERSNEEGADKPRERVRSRGVDSGSTGKADKPKPLAPGDDGYDGSTQEFLDNDPDTQINAAYDGADRQCKLASEKVNECRRQCPSKSELESECNQTVRIERRACKGDGKRECRKAVMKKHRSCVKKARGEARSCLSTCGTTKKVCEPIYSAAKKKARQWERKKKRKKRRR